MLKRNEIIKLHAQPVTVKRNLTYDEIAHKVGCSRQYVQQVIASWRLEQEKEKVKQLMQ